MISNNDWEVVQDVPSAAGERIFEVPGHGIMVLEGMRPGFKIYLRSRGAGGALTEYEIPVDLGPADPWMGNFESVRVTWNSAPLNSSLFKMLIFKERRIVATFGDGTFRGRRLCRGVYSSYATLGATTPVKLYDDGGNTPFGVSDIYSEEHFYRRDLYLNGVISSDKDFEVYIKAYQSFASAGIGSDPGAAVFYKADSVAITEEDGSTARFTWVPWLTSYGYGGTNVNSSPGQLIPWPINGGQIYIRAKAITTAYQGHLWLESEPF